MRSERDHDDDHCETVLSSNSWCKFRQAKITFVHPDELNRYLPTILSMLTVSYRLVLVLTMLCRGEDGKEPKDTCPRLGTDTPTPDESQGYAN